MCIAVYTVQCTLYTRLNNLPGQYMCGALEHWAGQLEALFDVCQRKHLCKVFPAIGWKLWRRRSILPVHWDALQCSAVIFNPVVFWWFLKFRILPLNSNENIEKMNIKKLYWFNLFLL